MAVMYNRGRVIVLAAKKLDCSHNSATKATASTSTDYVLPNNSPVGLCELNAVKLDVGVDCCETLLEARWLQKPAKMTVLILCFLLVFFRDPTV
jgi:hypothetical protein